MLANTFNNFIDQKQFHHVFQPIFSLHNSKILGYESLLRSDYGTPELIFEQAKMEEQIFELDTGSILKALHHYSLMGHFSKDKLLFVNIFPTTMVDIFFPYFLESILAKFPMVCQQIVFEFNETEKVNSDLVKQRVQLLKSYGFLFAIDDIGKGWSSLSRIIEFDPDFIKLDLYFSQALASAEKKQIMIKELLNYCESNHIHIILEGIEEEADLKVAKTIGVPYGQGYLLARPQVLERVPV